jgi:single-strand DNA-binding protein
MNNISITGRLTAEPELKYAGETPVLTFNLADPVGFGDKESTNWWRCSVWGQRGKALHNHLAKGQKVTVFGFVKNREYEKDGVKRVSNEVTVNEIDLGQKTSDQPKHEQQAKKPAQARSFDDFEEVPF